MSRAGDTGRTVPTFRQWLNAEYQEWIKMKIMLPEERKPLRVLGVIWPPLVKGLCDLL